MRLKCIFVIAALAYDFENSNLLRCAWVVKVDENETENGGDVCYCYFADYFCGN